MILEAGGSTLTQNAPYWPIARLLRKWFSILNPTTKRRSGARRAAVFCCAGDDMERLMPVCESLLDVPVEDQAWKALDPPARRASIQNDLVELVARGTRAQPVTLVFEDVQWFDAETQTLIRILSGRLEGSRAALLLTYRRDPAAGNTLCERSLLVDLHPLTSTEARRLLEDVALRGMLDAVDVDSIVHRAGGTPLFVEEIVRSLSAAASPVAPLQAGGARGAPRPVDTRTDVPPAIRSIMAARLDRLAPHLKHAVQIARRSARPARCPC